MKKKQIKNPEPIISQAPIDPFSFSLQTIGEYGIVDQINHPIVVIQGLPLAKPQEIVVFESGEFGEVFAINNDTIEALVFSKQPVKVNSKVVRTGNPLTVPVGKELLGQILTPLGKPIDSASSFAPLEKLEEREVDIVPPAITTRSRITKQFQTGVTLIDMMVPLGKGQKELILGDRKTGKTSYILTALKNQTKHGSIVVYAAIGKKISDIKRIEEFFEKENMKERTVIVAASSYEAPSYVYLSPFTAMTIAEYFRDIGNDVVLVLDDLSTHAKYYREISLLAKRFPGRDSYPGDIFYTHARLLERAGNFKHPKKGEVSITCFPIAETVEGDFTNYIVTNLMGVTDGHIFFDSNIYYKGRRPAINISLSVTRVGRQTQRPVKRHITRELTSFFSVYERMQSFSHFGAELTDSVKGILKTGETIYRYFDQPHEVIIPEEIQLILFTMVWYNLISENIDTWLDTYRVNLTNAYEQNESTRQFLQNILKVETFNQLLGNINRNRDKILSLCKKKTV